MKLWQKILLCIVAAEILGSLGGIITASSVRDWYAALTIPYLIWVSYVTYLNAGYWFLNR